jgi:hypothetical protein
MDIRRYHLGIDASGAGTLHPVIRGATRCGLLVESFATECTREMNLLKSLACWRRPESKPASAIGAIQHLKMNWLALGVQGRVSSPKAPALVR